MPAATAPRKKRRSASRKKSGRGLLLWWPLLLGIAVTPFTLHAASILALEGPGALRLLYPYMLLVQARFFGLSNDLGNTLSQVIMYAQFPVYGLIMSLALRFRGLVFALVTVLLVHGLGVAAVILLLHLHS